jgi:molybdate transport system substrate-binding protein
MRRISLLSAVMSLILVVNLTGCSSASRTIVVFAAASLKSTFTQIADRFKSDNPGTNVDFDFDGSSELASQLTQAAPADVFASANVAQMEIVADAGLLGGDPVNFASNTLVIITDPGNPKNIESFPDLARPDVRVVTCQQLVPCGEAARRIEDKTGVHLNPVSEESSVTAVLNRVTAGQADAGLVYVTDAVNAGNKVAMIRFSAAADAVNVYPIAVLKETPRQELAHKFVDLVTSEEGQVILSQAGFGRP